MRKDRALQGGCGALWVSPDGEVHDMDGTHNAWMLDNRELLSDKYGVHFEDGLEGYEMVDLLIGLGWIRVAQKANHPRKRSPIHFELRIDSGMYGRCENVLAERFPQVWGQGGTAIVVNNEEVDSSDLRRCGSLREAFEAEARHRHMTR